MSIYTKEITWPAWKFGVLKFSMIAFGILVGAAFPSFWATWTVWLWGVFLVTALISSVWGIQAMFGRKRVESH